jgi:ABC-type transporter Mla MlaB component
MATKDDRPGLLSKVAMFVRNPTKDWSELDQPVDSEANGYDKQALKAMIERKRQNDFVRKREFDQLRKLRDRDPGAIASLARQSFFQNSLPSDLGGRAVTLKKIDEIEAQMSRQWWKSKGAGVVQQTSVFPQGDATVPPPDLSNSELHPSDSDMSAPFAVTEPASVRRGEGADFADEFIPTQMAADMAALPNLALVDGVPARPEGSANFSTSRLFAIEDDTQETDPELEEGAIRFANSDDAGAEKGLLAALRAQGSATAATQAWVGALMDLYRATNNRAAFEAAFHEFALQLDGVRPVWFALGDPDAPSLPPPARSAEAGARIWNCPAHLTAQAMESLRLAMVSRPMPWYLGWGELEQIAPDAVALLDGLFGSLCDEVVALRFDGEERLVRALRSLTPSGNRAVSPTCWQLRMNALRAMGLQDDFELAALDYCVTYGVAPPSWVQARCRLEGSATAGDARPPEPAADQEPDAHTLVLAGQILGDATQALLALNAAPAGDQQVLISCRDLIRVDFAAAGGILNWVAMRQAEGNRVQFLDVHRLVAAFFNVIGINEHAKVVLRAI